MAQPIEIIQPMQEVADRLGVPVQWLMNLIAFESGFNPRAANPNSTAKGIMQWVDARAQDMGYATSQALIDANPTFMDQLSILERDLSRYKPFPDKQSFYMAVFYPAARYWDPDHEFPEHIQDLNSGIRTPADYTAYVDRMASDVVGPAIVAAQILDPFKLRTWAIAGAIAFGLYFTFKKR